MSVEATQLIKSSSPNAFAIENTNGNNVFMSLKNSENQLDIQLKDTDFIFSAKNENTKLLYKNIDFSVDEISVNKILNNDFSNITIEGNINITNGLLTHENRNVLVLTSENKIPTSYINNASYLTIQNTQSNIYIPNSTIMINTSNTLNMNSAITIKNNATNSEEITVQLVDGYDNGTIKIYSQDPYISIGYNNPNKTNNIQLCVESNIKCNDIIVNDNSILDFYNDYKDYKSNNDITGVNIKTDKLYYYDNKIILEPDIKPFRTKDDFIFNPTNFINITNILCSANNTYIVTLDNTLYRLIPDNRYYYIDTNIENIKSENGIIIYKKLNDIYFIYDDYTINIETGYRTGGYFNNFQYLANNTQVIRKSKVNNANIEIVVSSIRNVTDISVINTSNIYIKQNENLLFYNMLDGNSELINSNVSLYHLGFNGAIYYDSNLSVSSLTSNVYKIMNNNLYTLGNNVLLESNVLKVHHSNRHIVLLKTDNKLYTRAFDNNYIGLGRSSFSILDNSLNKFIGLGVQAKDIMIIKNAVNIGSSLDVFNNEVPNSLCVENCIAIGCKPLNDFALRLKGNILIEGGGNIYRTSDMKTLYSSSNINSLTLDDYVKYEDFDIRVDGITSNIENILLCNLNVNKNNIDKLIYDAENAINLWVKESNIVTVHNTRVSINPSDNDDYSVLGGSKLPALFIGNYSSNIRGLICEDDIAAFSDESLKTDIKAIPDALNKVLQLNGVNYRRKDNIDKICMGVIAQNIEKYCPEVVYEYNGLKTVAYQNLVALLIEAVKDLYAIIKDGKE